MIDPKNAEREARIAARTEVYVHRAKRMMLDLFGQEAAHDQPVITMQLVSAMIQLETADIIAEAGQRLRHTLETKEF